MALWCVVHFHGYAEGGLFPPTRRDGEVKVVDDRLRYHSPLVGVCCAGAVAYGPGELLEFLDAVGERGLVPATEPLVCVGGMLSHGRRHARLQLHTSPLGGREAAEHDVADLLHAHHAVPLPQCLIREHLEDCNHCGRRHGNGTAATGHRGTYSGRQFAGPDCDHVLMARWQRIGSAPVRKLFCGGRRGRGCRCDRELIASPLPSNLDSTPHPFHLGDVGLLLFVRDRLRWRPLFRTSLGRLHLFWRFIF
mmetsp:Transcript_90131/g.255445  ORF Transcript_90131/g.255445 Transcript_90131/m.255445 type:complete len:250 (-) Transcript_90131:1317-2066(-)